ARAAPKSGVEGRHGLCPVWEKFNEKRSSLHRFFSPGNGPVLGGPGRGLDSWARRELHGERAAMDLLRRRHRRDRACPDPAGAPIIASPFHPIFCFSAVRPLIAQSGHFSWRQPCLLFGGKRTSLRAAPMSAYVPKRTSAAQDCCRAK